MYSNEALIYAHINKLPVQILIYANVFLPEGVACPPSFLSL